MFGTSAGTLILDVKPDVAGLGTGLGTSIDRSMRTQQGRFGALGGQLGGWLKVGALSGVAAIGAGAVAAVREAMDAEKIQAQTEAVIKSTGGAAQLSADQVSALAEALSETAAVDDEVIQDGSNLLLTFKNIQDRVGEGNDIFSQANEVMVDMSRAMDQDMRTSALQLGKALNDPIAGMTALARVGVQFSEDQKKQIENFVEAGDVMSAQKIILQELTDEFGGSAKAYAKTTEGTLEGLKVVWSNILENIGKKLLPFIKDAAKWLRNHADDIGDFFANWAAGIDDVVGALQGLVKWTGRAIEGIVGVIDAIQDYVQANRDRKQHEANEEDLYKNIIKDPNASKEQKDYAKARLQGKDTTGLGTYGFGATAAQVFTNTQRIPRAGQAIGMVQLIIDDKTAFNAHVRDLARDEDRRHDEHHDLVGGGR